MNTHHTHESSHRKMTPEYFFLTLGMFISLVTVSVAFINLLFATLDQKFPDIMNATYQFGYNTAVYEGVRTTLATVIIFFPVYFLLSYFWARASHTTLSHHNAILRKWVLYIILFLSVLMVAIDLVTLVRYFIAGELTIRFMLKVLSIFVISGVLFTYYVNELKGLWKLLHWKKYIFPVLSWSMIFFGVLYSFSVIGSPQTQRALRLDQKRIEDLQNIQSQVITYWQQKEVLPEKLEMLVDPLNSYQVLPKDPEFQSGIEYEYLKTGDLEFQLCATFLKPIPQGWQEVGTGVYPMTTDVRTSEKGYIGAQNENWSHLAGRTCFTRRIDPDVYPPFNKDTPKPL